MKIGFSGTRKGMRTAQRETFRAILTELRPSDFHHGDCVGADEEAHDVATDFMAWMVAHPPIDPKLRAWTANDETRDPKPYLQRNIDIVDETDLLIATPGRMAEQQSGGTWHTIRHARAVNKPVIIVWPDGSTQPRRWQELVAKVPA